MVHRLLIGLAVLAGGCLDTATFYCTTRGQCGSGGRCEPDNLCSFPDSSCASGFRYGALSGGSADQCVGSGGDGSAQSAR